MSPEQARGDALQIDARTDIWGIGATMFALLTGRFVHASSRQKNLVVAAATEPAPPILSVNPDIEPSLARVVDRAVQMDKEKRWPNARAMLAELRTLEVPRSAVRPVRAAPTVEGATMSTTSASQMSWSQAKTWLTRIDPARGSRTRLLVAVTLAGVVVLVALQRFASDRSAAENTAAMSKTDVVAHPVPSVAVVPLKTPPVLTSAAEKTPATSPTEERVTTKRPLPAKGPPRKRQAPAVPPSAATPAPAAVLSIPDDVLDLRD
jgi:hypothetical protein